MYVCPTCKKDNAFVNQCGCDPNNMPTRLPVHRHEDKTPGAWAAFIAAMHSGEQFECDQEMYVYWLEVLPPAFMGREVTWPDGQKVKAHFGFAEGEDYITAFWCVGGSWWAETGVRYFGRRTNILNV